MVQLKDTMILASQERYRVSIPYGSIKRNREDLFAKKKSMFQFLMVQLKVSPIPTRASFDLVSIPYGSIKRWCIVNSPHVLLWFQFLMVQLKVLTDCKAPLFLACFNSLWFN